jgi:hypothetical protein
MKYLATAAALACGLASCAPPCDTPECYIARQQSGVALMGYGAQMLSPRPSVTCYSSGPWTHCQ